MSFTTDNTKSHFPLSGVPNDGWSIEDEATASCFCGAIQLAFPTHGPGLVGTLLFHCADCRKITASMFASNFTVDDKYLKHVRGQDNLYRISQAHDQPLLLNLWNAYVSRWSGISWKKCFEDWYCRRFQFA